MNNIKVSIIMPVLNGMPYFKKALDSVVNQTLKEIEILVVDSGSSDGTREHALEIIKTDNRVRLLYVEKKSMGYQYNAGIREARGEYVGFCESDDYIEKEAYETFYTEAMRQQWPEAVKSDFYMFFHKKGKKYDFCYSILPQKMSELYGRSINLFQVPLLFSRDVNMWNGIYKKAFLVEKQIVLNETDGAAFQDTSFVLQVNMSAERMVYISNAFYHYRKDNDNSSIYGKKNYRFAMWELVYMLEWLEKNICYKLLYEADVLGRLFYYFAELYGNYISRNEENLEEKELGFLRKKLKNLYEQQDYSVLAEIEHLELFWLFLESEKAFREVAKRKAEKQKKDFERFWNFVEEKKNIILFGAGEYGKNLLAFLIKNDYPGEICFCDNNKNKQETKIFGYDVWSVEDVCKNNPDALFLIPSKLLYREMKVQLLNLGIKSERILTAPEISLHVATEMKIMDRGGR